VFATVRTHFAYGNFRPDTLASPGNHIVKSHEVRSIPVASFLEKNACVILITIRGPRNTVTSKMRSHSCDFAKTLAYVEEVFPLCARMAAQPNAHVMYYETRFFDNIATIPALAKLVGHEVSGVAMDGIFAKLTRSEVEKYIATLPGKPGIPVSQDSTDYLDPATHWHTHHAGRKGEVGGFRNRLTANQIQEIEQRHVQPLFIRAA
jgi:hypothetical protein